LQIGAKRSFAASINLRVVDLPIDHTYFVRDLSSYPAQPPRLVPIGWREEVDRVFEAVPAAA
jgi:hypothetical protein